jgi:phosphoribosyl 1,2-cyclic phosphate phosphodiesterase
LKIQFLGTGSAEGIPAIGCDCPHCARAKREGGRLVKRRNAIFLSLPGYELLLDTPPDIRASLAQSKVLRIDGIFLTHTHYDHTGGLEEFLYWKRDLDLFVEPRVYEFLRRENWGDTLPDVAFHCPFHPGMAVRFDGFFFTPFAVSHTVLCFGLAIYEGDHKIVYTSDTRNRFSNYARSLMDGADLLIVNTPHFAPPHEDHITSVEAVELKERIGASRLVLTHCNHRNLPHDELEEWAKGLDGVTVAYDGLEIETQGS